MAVAEAINGKVNPAKLLSMPKSDTTLYVGPMRTSTGSIKVTKIIQKTAMRNGNLKYTIANAESKDIAIFPTAMSNAQTKLTPIMRATEAVEPEPFLSPSKALV